MDLQTANVTWRHTGLSASVCHRRKWSWTSHHRTQSEAERAARNIAINQRSEVLIHGENGRIRERNSYGNDPHPPKG